MSAIQERSISANEQNEFAQYAAQALKNLGFGEAEAAPEAIIEAIGKFVETWQAEQRKPFSRFKRKPDSIDVALGLGTLWGNQLTRALGWQWTCLLQEEREYFALVSADRAYAVYPTYWMRAFLEEANKDNTVILLFNMLKAGKLPPSEPNRYYALS